MIPKTVTIESLLLPRKKISGVYSPPPDKSITHRAVFFASLSSDASRIRNPLSSGDCLSTFKAFAKLGIGIKKSRSEWIVEKGKKAKRTALRELSAPTSDLDCGNSGTTTRLLCGMLSGQKFDSRLVGDESLSSRPMKRVIEPLSQMGASISSTAKGTAPLEIRGNPALTGISWKSPVSSAQVKSSILLAGLHAIGKTTVIEPVRSRDHTERMLQIMGADIWYKKTGTPMGENKVSVSAGKVLLGLDIAIPGDFSSAAFFIAAALLVPGSDLTIRNVNLNPTRTGFLDVVKRMGADIRVHDQREENGEPIGDLQVRHSALKGTTVEPEEIPLLVDEVPVLAVLATQARGITEVKGAGELRVKETDRLAAISSELKKMGAKIQESKDGLAVEGETQLKGAIVRSHHDHRMAMSLAIAGLVATKWSTMIEDFDCIQISFPSFHEDLTGLTR